MGYSSTWTGHRGASAANPISISGPDAPGTSLAKPIGHPPFPPWWRMDQCFWVSAVYFSPFPRPAACTSRSSLGCKLLRGWSVCYLFWLPRVPPRTWNISELSKCWTHEQGGSSMSGIGQIQPLDQLWPRACFCR